MQIYTKVGPRIATARVPVTNAKRWGGGLEFPELLGEGRPIGLWKTT